jgi:hypothetical protein
LRGKLEALAQAHPELSQSQIDRYLLKVGQTLRHFEDPISTAEARRALSELDQATQTLGRQAGSDQTGSLMRQSGQISKEFLSAYLAHRTLTTTGEIIEVSHNIGGALKNLAFPVFDVQPLDHAGNPIKSNHSINDLGDRISNTAGVAALYLQEWLDPNGNLSVYSTSPFALNSGGSFTPGGIPLPDYPNIRPAFHAGIAYSQPGWGLQMGSVVNSAVGERGVPKEYLDTHLTTAMAAGQQQVTMTFDPLDPARLAPFMGPSTSMLHLGAHLDPNHFLGTTSPLLQNGRLEGGVTLANPSSPSQTTEHIRADGSVGSETRPAPWTSYQVRYNLPLSNMLPRLERGWLGSGEFLNRFAENSRLGVSAAYNSVQGMLPGGQNPRSSAGWRVAPTLSTQIVNLGGNEGAAFWEQFGEGMLRMVLAGALQSGMNYGYQHLAGQPKP